MLACVTSDLEYVPSCNQWVIVKLGWFAESTLDFTLTVLVNHVCSTVSANEKREWFVQIRNLCRKSWLKISWVQPTSSGRDDHISNMQLSRAGLIIKHMFPSWFHVLMLYWCSVSQETHRSMGLEIKMHLKCFQQNSTCNSQLSEWDESINFPKTATCDFKLKHFLSSPVLLNLASILPLLLLLFSSYLYAPPSVHCKSLIKHITLAWLQYMKSREREVVEVRGRERNSVRGAEGGGDEGGLSSCSVKVEE